MRIGGRRFLDRLGRAAVTLAAVLAVAPLAGVLVWVLARGVPALAAERGEGLALLLSALWGTARVAAVAAVIGLPVGLASGVLVAEWPGSPVARAARRAAALLAGVPTLLVGLVTFELLVVRQGHFSVLAGGVALSVVLAPHVALAAEHHLASARPELRNEARALGATRLGALVWVVLPSAAPGLAQSALLAVALVVGETAPVLLTVLGSSTTGRGFDEPAALLPLEIVAAATAPSAARQGHAFACALVLVLAVGVVQLAARVAGRRAKEAR